jgi:hypothetical protein
MQVGREAGKSQLSADDDNRNNAQCQHSQSGNGISEGADRKRESSAHGKVCYILSSLNSSFYFSPSLQRIEFLRA